LRSLKRTNVEDNDNTEIKNENNEESSDQEEEEESFEEDTTNEEDINNSILSEALQQTKNKFAQLRIETHNKIQPTNSETHDRQNISNPDLSNAEITPVKNMELYEDNESSLSEEDTQSTENSHE
jgi:hypothetical protein